MSTDTTIYWHNVANANRDTEKGWPLDVPFAEGEPSRLDRIMADIQQAGAHIVVLGEIRATPRDEHGTMWSANDLCGHVARELGQEWQHVMLLRNDAPSSFATVVIFNSTEVFCRGVQSHWPASTVPAGSDWTPHVVEAMFFRKPHCTSDRGVFVTGMPFTVIACHAGMSRAGREEYALLVRSRLEANQKKEVCVVVGDFNSFEDDADPVREQNPQLPHHMVRTVLGDSQFARALIPPEVKTFVSFPHDMNRATGEPFRTHLDHAIVTHPTQDPLPLASAYVIGEGTVDPGDRTRPSDHFAVVVKLCTDVSV